MRKKEKPEERKTPEKTDRSVAKPTIDKQTGKKMCLDICTSVYEKLQEVHDDIMQTDQEIIKQQGRLIRVIEYLKKVELDDKDRKEERQAIYA